MAKLTPLSKALIVAVALGAAGIVLYAAGRRSRPAETAAGARLPPPSDGGKPVARPPAPGKPGCADKPEVRMAIWAWNAQMGLLAANGGLRAAEGSLMCKHGVNLKLVREEAVDTMESLFLVFAEDLKNGTPEWNNGVQFLSVMGNSSAALLASLNARMAKAGPGWAAVVIGSPGSSRGENKFMGPPAWKADPQKARGALVAGSIRDGDWSLALKWMAENGVPNNPDDTVYDPDAVNWHPAVDALDAAQKYASSYCTDLENKKTRAMEKRCVEAVVTRTPGDVTVAEERGGLVTLVSTKDSPTLIPDVIVGNTKWMEANRPIVEGMLAAIFEGSDLVSKDPAALRRAAEISAEVYGDKDAAYWQTYFQGTTVKDKQGMEVELGGSGVNNLADNVALFGVAAGSAHPFAATYTSFGELVKAQYPEAMAAIAPVEKILDTSFIAALAKLPAAPRAPESRQP